MVLQTFFVVSDTCSKVGPAERLDRPPISTALTAAFDSLLPTVEQAVVFHVLAPLVASMRPSGRGQPRVDRRPALDRRQGGSARMRVHVSERCMGQERAREVIHGLRGRQPCGQSLEQGGSLHRRCHLFNEFHIGVIMSSDMRPTQCVRPALERPLPMAQ